MEINRYFVVKEKIMSIAEIRLQLHQVIDTVDDGEKLEAIYTLLKNSNSPYKSMSLDEYVGAIDEARQEIKGGNYMSIDELEKEAENW